MYQLAESETGEGRPGGGPILLAGRGRAGRIIRRGATESRIKPSPHKERSMRRLKLVLVALFFATAVRGWAGNDPPPKQPASLADDAKALAGPDRQTWQLKPVTIKVNGKDTEVTPQLVFSGVGKGQAEGTVFYGAVQADEISARAAGTSAEFTLTEKDKKRCIVITDDPKVVLAYTLDGEKLKITCDKKVQVLGLGEIDFSGEWTRKK
jgi:hypothetical protein